MCFGVQLLILLSVSMQSSAQYRYLEEPQESLKIPRLRYVTLNVEAEETSQQSTIGSRSEYQRLYISPAIGISWDYFIYHPDLLNFSVLAEPGYAWEISGPPGGAMRERNDILVNGTFNGRLLQLKPYATTIFAASTHDTHQYDFFNSVVEDARSWGFLSGYRNGPVPVTIGFQQVMRETSGFNLNTSSEQFTFDIHARNDRQHDNFTDFSYQFSRYDSTSGLGPERFRDKSEFHYLTLTDVENFNNR